MEDVRHMHELPYVAHFVNNKRALMKFPNIEIRSFEICICDGKSKLFQDIVSRILRHIKNNTEIRIDNCEKHLRSYTEENKSEISQLVKQDFISVTGPDRLRILKWLADQTKEKKNDIDEMLNEEFGGDSQLDPTIINVGQDSENRTYWYFDDLRLYRQKSGQSKGSGDWQCLATSCSTWEEVIGNFSQSTDDQEQDLHAYLSNQLYPAIKPLLETQSPEPAVITNKDLLAAEAWEMEGNRSSQTPATSEAPPTPTADQSELIKSENPELLKVLSEEPYAGKNNSAQINGEFREAKKSGSLTYSQQQNQLYIFSSQMANRAVDSVASRAHPSIFHFHLDDPETKQFLQVNHTKPMLPTSQSRDPMMPPKVSNPHRHPRAHHGPPSSSAPLMWNDMKSPSYSNQHLPRQAYGRGAMYMGHDMKSSMTPNISHQSVPDERLTPSQRQHRENSLASLKRIQQMLFADGGMGESDFSHINMAQDQQPQYLPPCSQAPQYNLGGYGMNQQPPPSAAPMPMYSPGMPSMAPQMHPCMMESKPPPPYPVLPSNAPSQPVPAVPKKAGRKRKSSAAASPAQTPPLDHPPIKMEKPAIPPSPLASQPHTPNPTNPQAVKPEDVGVSGPVKGAMQHSVARQHSMPNLLPPKTSGPPYRMMQAGQPTPYQGTPAMGGPPSYNSSLRRGQSAESMTVPPSQRHMYMQPENQERAIEKQLNTAHQPHSSAAAMPGNADLQQPMYANMPSSQSNIDSRDGGLSNITSASLANIAKGMEQMSQKIAQNGPYGELHRVAPHPDPNSSEQPRNGPPPSSAAGGQHPPPHSSHHSVNNTFVNAHMSIGQLNIQNVTADQSYQGSGVPPHMQQHVDVSMNNFSGGMPPPGPQPDPMYKPPQPAPAPPAAAQPGPAPTAPAVSIQNKGSSTISYLPVTQPSIPPSHDPVLPAKPNYDFLAAERFPPANPGYLSSEGGHSMMMPGPMPHRPPGSMYGRHVPPPGASHMMPSVAAGPMTGMHMSESIPRGAAPSYMMSSHQSSMSMGYNPAPTPGVHPGAMDSRVHMRSQHVMMSAPGYPGHPGHPSHAAMRPSGYAVSPGYQHPSATPPQAGMPSYAPPPVDYPPGPAPPGHPMGARMQSIQQPVAMAHQPPGYMGAPSNSPFM